MRLFKSKALRSVFIAVMLTAGSLASAPLDGVTPPQSYLSEALSSIAAEFLVRPAYAKKKDKDKDKDKEKRNGRKKDRDGWDDGFKKDAKKKPDTSNDGGWNNGGGNPVASGGKDGGQSKTKDTSKDNDAAKTSAAKNDPAKKDASKDKDTSTDGEDDANTEAPAATVEQFFKKIAKPAAPKPRTPRIADYNPGMANLEAPSTEILATGMDAAGLAKAKSLGFKPIETLNTPGGKTVTKLAPPSYMNRRAAHTVLSTQFVSGFAENHTYIIYAPMTGAEKDGIDSSPLDGLRTGQCREDRCVGRAAICWSSEFAKRASRVKIGIIDTPIDRDHPAFEGRNIKIGSFLGNYTRSATDWHGTAVLALLSGSLDSGVPGLAPEAEFYVAETFRTDDQGIATTDSASILKALAWFEIQNVKLINMSFSGPKDVLVEQAVQRMRANGFTFVAAAGNFGPTAAPSYPAAYKEVIAVTAITKDGMIYPGANTGDYIDLAAPGVKIWTALPGGKEGFRTGTSFAAPFVTGVLAASLNPAKAGKAEVEDLRAVKTVDLGPPGVDKIFGRGLAIVSTGCGVGYARAPEPTRTSAQETGTPPSGLGADVPSFGVMTVVPASSPSE